MALSTILIIASVGYAQKRPLTRPIVTPASVVAASANKTRTDANDTRTGATREEFVTAWRANGHQSIAALAHELNVNVRTAQKWVKADDTTVGTPPS